MTPLGIQGELFPGILVLTGFLFPLGGSSTVQELPLSTSDPFAGHAGWARLRMFATLSSNPRAIPWLGET